MKCLPIITLLACNLFVMPLMSDPPHATESLQLKSYEDLQGWNDDNHSDALMVFMRSCREITTTGHGFKRAPRYGGTRDQWVEVCERATHANNPREFFQDEFLPFQISDPELPKSLLTGYYEPLAEGSRVQSRDYPVPIYAKPPDLVALTQSQQLENGLAYARIVSGLPQPYFTREEIERGKLSGKGLEIVWLKSWEDAFFIHIQGSGRIRMKQGGEIRLAYAGKSGLPYTGIGRVLIDRGVLTKETNSMQAIRTWMKNNQSEARKLMWHNKSFVFFRKIEVDDASLGALGAQQVNLTPGRSLAVDRSIWMFGTPVWIDTVLPPEAPQGIHPMKRLMIAQDTGSAIKGAARGDIYWGWGSEAEQIAGHMKSPAGMVVLLPKSVANTVGLVK
jgi:membrane-bound lytic murein transglycosylase A